jgi:hypothetical protein
MISSVSGQRRPREPASSARTLRLPTARCHPPHHLLLLLRVWSRLVLPTVGWSGTGRRRQSPRHVRHRASISTKYHGEYSTRSLRTVHADGYDYQRVLYIDAEGTRKYVQLARLPGEPSISHSNTCHVRVHRYHRVSAETAQP